MTVKQLITKLRKEDPNRLVVLSSDEEGNSYSPLADIWTGAYDEENQEVGLEKLTPSLRGDGYTEEDVMTDGKPALFLVP